MSIRVLEYFLIAIPAPMARISLEWPGEAHTNFQSGMLTEVAMFLISPAQGGMFAPLALKSVSSSSFMPG